MTDKFKSGDVVLYTPRHLQGTADHSRDERGTVTKRNDRFVFVRFDITGAVQACYPADLRLEIKVATKLENI